MAGRITYKDMTLAELEAKEAERTAAGQRIPAALKMALQSARADWDAETTPEPGEAAAPAPEPETSETDAKLTAAEAAERDEVFSQNMMAVLGGQATADEAFENITSAADERASRKHFRQRVMKLMDDGFTVEQAAEALTAEFPEESAAELAAHSMDTSIVLDQPPARDPRDVDMRTGELKADRPAEQPAPPAEAYALVEAVAKPVTYYWARVTICVPVEGGGETTETISCTCQYGHEREDLAIKHAKKLAAERGIRLA